MIVRILKYSYAQAKTRALKGKLLSAEDWHFILRCREVESVLTYLRGTDYAEVLAHLPKEKTDAEVMALLLYDQLFRDYAKLLKAVPEKNASIIEALFSRYEAENLKTILRGIRAGKTAADMRFFLYHSGRLSRLPVGQLLLAKDIQSAIELLKSTMFYTSLIHAMPQFKVQGSLFPLEVAVDMAVFENIAETIKSLKGLDRRGAEGVIGELIDFENLSWLARFRHFYGLSAEETINYMLSGGRRLGIRKLAGLARSTDLASLREILPPPYRDIVRDAKNWPEIEPLFERWILFQLHKVFRKNPFQICLQLSYLLLKEFEIKVLEGFLSALDLGEMPEQLLEFIPLASIGGVRVQA